VFEGVHNPTGRQCAVKLMKRDYYASDPVKYERLKLEIAAMQKIVHRRTCAWHVI
jgi:hypothetical protein